MAEHGFPSLDEIYEKLDRFVDEHPDVARAESLGASTDGLDVKAVHVTDADVDEADKEVAMVVCGRHGNELGTRFVGQAVLEWLASEEGAETRRRQLVVVVPVANPDGCVREEFHAPNDGLSETEQKTIAALADRLRPDAVVDIHSFGSVRADIQSVITANTKRTGEDVFIHYRIACEMAAEAQRAGYPCNAYQLPPRDGYNNFFCGPCYERFHSLVFGMEVNHGSLSPSEAAESGAAMIASLLRAGNVRWPWQGTSGYPSRILAGDFFTSIRPLGDVAAERRESRCAIWQKHADFQFVSREMLKPNVFRAVVEYPAEGIDGGFALCCRFRGERKPGSARLNGQDVEAKLFMDNCSTYIAVEVRSSSESKHELALEF